MNLYIVIKMMISWIIINFIRYWFFIILFTVLHCILGSTFTWSNPFVCWPWNCYIFSLWFIGFNLRKVYI